MNRRSFLTAAGVLTARPVLAGFSPGLGLRGSIDGNPHLMLAAASDDPSRALQDALDAAAADDRPLFLPAGRYEVANLVLPPRTRIQGVAGATWLVFSGEGHLLVGENCTVVQLIDLGFDGGNRPLAAYVPGLVHLSGCDEVLIEGCTVAGSAGSGLALDRSAGRVTRSHIRGAAEAGIRAIESRGLSITDNIVTDCGNGGILVHRWETGEDGTIVTGNRVERIAAEAGGTGQNGNGINVFQAGGVIVANNRIADCAFTAVRCNTASNVQVIGNSCLRSGEVGIYSEFGFEAAVIANNVVDIAAAGISVANFMQGGRIATVSGNIVRRLTAKGPYPPDPPGFGYGIYVEADAAVTGNVVDGAPLYGIGLGWGPYLRDVSATGNVIRGAPVGFALSVVEGTGSAVIADNVISGATDGAVVGYRWAEKATGDLTRGDPPAGLVIRGNVTG